MSVHVIMYVCTCVCLYAELGRICRCCREFHTSHIMRHSRANEPNSLHLHTQQIPHNTLYSYKTLIFTQILVSVSIVVFSDIDEQRVNIQIFQCLQKKNDFSKYFRALVFKKEGCPRPFYILSKDIMKTTSDDKSYSFSRRSKNKYFCFPTYSTKILFLFFADMRAMRTTFYNLKSFKAIPVKCGYISIVCNRGKSFFPSLWR